MQRHSRKVAPAGVQLQMLRRQRRQTEHAAVEGSTESFLGKASHLIGAPWSCKFLQLPKGREVECFVEVSLDQKDALQLDWTVVIPKDSPKKKQNVSRLMNPLDETLLDTAGLQRRVAQLVEPWHFMTRSAVLYAGIHVGLGNVPFIQWIARDFCTNSRFQAGATATSYHSAIFWDSVASWLVLVVGWRPDWHHFFT